MDNKALKLEAAKKLIEQYDFVGLAEAYAKSERQWHAKEWKQFAETVRAAYRAELRGKIKDLREVYGGEILLEKILALLDEGVDDE